MAILKVFQNNANFVYRSQLSETQSHNHCYCHLLYKGIIYLPILDTVRYHSFFLIWLLKANKLLSTSHQKLQFPSFVIYPTLTHCFVAVLKSISQKLPNLVILASMKVAKFCHFMQYKSCQIWQYLKLAKFGNFKQSKSRQFGYSYEVVQIWQNQRSLKVTKFGPLTYVPEASVDTRQTCE